MKITLKNVENNFPHFFLQDLNRIAHLKLIRGNLKLYDKRIQFLFLWIEGKKRG